MAAREDLGRVRTLSAFLPCYDEAGNVERVVQSLITVLSGLGLDGFEVIVIDDGSRDATGRIADELAIADDRIRVVHHAVNVGYGGALRTGIEAARMDWIFFTDGDGQFDPAEIVRLTSHTVDHDLVVGYRHERSDAWVRRLNMHLWTALVNRLFRLEVRDVDCAFKLVLRQRVVAIGPLTSNGAFASTEMFAKLRRSGVVPCEVAVSHFARQWGSPTGADVGVIARAFGDLFRLRRSLGRWTPGPPELR